MYILQSYRRAHLRDCLETLKEIVPMPPDHQKSTTLSLLQNASQYIKVKKDNVCIYHNYILMLYISFNNIGNKQIIMRIFNNLLILHEIKIVLLKTCERPMATHARMTFL